MSYQGSEVPYRTPRCGDMAGSREGCCRAGALRLRRHRHSGGDAEGGGSSHPGHIHHRHIQGDEEGDQNDLLWAGFGELPERVHIEGKCTFRKGAEMVVSLNLLC